MRHVGKNDLSWGPGERPTNDLMWVCAAAMYREFSASIILGEVYYIGGTRARVVVSTQAAAGGQLGSQIENVKQVNTWSQPTYSFDCLPVLEAMQCAEGSVPGIGHRGDVQHQMMREADRRTGTGWLVR